MVREGEILVWRARLDALGASALPQAPAGEQERAGRLASQQARDRLLRSHGVLRAILEGLGLPADFARDERNKPYLPGRPDIHFSMSRSHGMALYAVSSRTPVGVDVEHVRPLAEWEAIAERFFPPSRYAELLDAAPGKRPAEFFRLWTRLEAELKALGVGLYGAGAEIEGSWTIEDLDAGEDFAAAVAAPAAGLRVVVSDFVSP